MQPDAAMRGGTAEARNLVAPVDGEAVVKEDRIRHRRVVILLREPCASEVLGPIDSARGTKAGAPGRDCPVVTRDAVDRNGHALLRLVNRDEYRAFGAAGARSEGRKQHDRDGQTTHDETPNAKSF